MATSAASTEMLSRPYHGAGPVFVYVAKNELLLIVKPEKPVFKPILNPLNLEIFGFRIINSLPSKADQLHDRI